MTLTIAELQEQRDREDSKLRLDKAIITLTVELGATRDGDTVIEATNWYNREE